MCSVKTVAANPGELGGLVEQLLDSKVAPLAYRSGSGYDCL